MVKRLLLDPQAEHPPKQNFVKYPPGLKADAFCLCLRYEQDFRIHARINSNIQSHEKTRKVLIHIGL